MKKSISILFCLFMFPLSISTGQELREGYHVDYDSLPPGCPSVTGGDDAARIECFQNNEKAYRESLMDIQRQNEALLEGIDKIHNEGSITQRKTIDEQQQGITELSSLLQECRTTRSSSTSQVINDINNAYEECRLKLQAAEAMSTGFQEQLNQSQNSLADKDVKIADLESQLSAERAAAKGAFNRIADLEGQLSASRDAQESSNAKSADFQREPALRGGEQKDAISCVAELQRGGHGGVSSEPLFFTLCKRANKEGWDFPTLLTVIRAWQQSDVEALMEIIYRK